MNGPSHTSWLWWLATIIGMAAGGIIYYIKQDTGYINSRQTINTVVLFAVVAIGLCIISATAHWWIRR
ncbi:MAG TPA: hypothetical protein PJ991_01660 [Kiritimatiellia bacterium]|nr:hypothetical protein [Kiritimatiellia bacterium]